MRQNKTYENPWIHNGKIFTEDDINGYYGFVYVIENLQTGKKYIGRKYFHTYRKPKGKSRRVKKQSDWKTYYGSHKGLLEEIKELGKENYSRTILHLHKAKGAVNYFEVFEQWSRGVLLTDEYYNDNIQGKYFKERVRQYHENCD